ncbi:MAG: hypothetical protein E7369_03905 [Clostridiales bacterium]|nr:hypothetical protein [Clostridiales bacterium]
MIYINKKGLIYKKNSFSFISLILACLTILLIVGEFFISTYIDEIAVLISLIFLVQLSMRKVLSKQDLLIMGLMIVFIVLGLVATLISRIAVSFFSVAMDVFSYLKAFAVFFAIKYALREEDIKENYLKMLTPIVKIFVVVTFVCCVMAIFVDIGMSNKMRYGLRNFVFLCPQSHQLYNALFVCGAILISKKCRYLKYYMFMILFTTAWTLQGPAFVFVVVFLFLLLLFKNKKKIGFFAILLMLLLVLWVGQYQIEMYLTDENSVRAKFYEYAFVTALRFFPLGSGFASYGSSQAAVNYSTLYYEYGFDRLWGMSPESENGMFLRDNGFAMYLGQNGFLGFILFLIILFLVFRLISNKNMNFIARAFILSIFANTMIHAVGTAILTSSSGVNGFVAMGIILACCVEKDDKGSESGLKPLIR